MSIVTGTKVTLETTNDKTIIEADGTFTIDTSTSDSGGTLGEEITNVAIGKTGESTTRGSTMEIVKRLSKVTQSFESLALTSGLVEIRTGITTKHTSTTAVTTTFDSPFVGGVPDVIIILPRSDATGTTNPKLVSKTASSFVSRLGASGGRNATCDYLAIRFNYDVNDY